MSVRFVYVLAAAMTVACASSGAPSSGIERKSNVISEQEIAETHASNAYEVINRARPTFLRSRGRSTISAGTSEFASVYLDGQAYGNIGTLKNIPAQQIREIRYYSASDAVTKFGMQSGSGVIEVRTK
jgi:hypothetical protein